MTTSLELDVISIGAIARFAGDIAIVIPVILTAQLCDIDHWPTFTGLLSLAYFHWPIFTGCRLDFQQFGNTNKQERSPRVLAQDAQISGGFCPSAVSFRDSPVGLWDL